MPTAAYSPNLPALQFAAGRTILPTTLSSRKLLELPAEIRQAAVFSAGVTEASVLELVHSKISLMASGLKGAPGETQNLAGVRSDLKELLQRISYAPADPKDDGTIKDLRTDVRLNLIIETQLRMAHGWADMQRSMSPAVRLLYPAAEFKRRYIRRVPRGYKMKQGALVAENPRYWQDRWIRAGGKIYEGRMIAPIDDPVWVKLSRFGLNQDPVDFGTGYGRRSVGAAEALRLGVVSREDLRALRLAASPSGQVAAQPVPSSESKVPGSTAPVPLNAPVTPAAPSQLGIRNSKLGTPRSPDSGLQALLTPDSSAAASSPSAARLIDSFSANAASFFPALRAALVNKLRGLFELDQNGVLVAAKGAVQP